MKIISSKRYKELLDYESKYNFLTGQIVTFWTGQRSRYKALLELSKEELVRRLLDFNSYAIKLKMEFKNVKNKR